MTTPNDESKQPDSRPKDRLSAELRLSVQRVSKARARLVIVEALLAGQRHSDEQEHLPTALGDTLQQRKAQRDWLILNSNPHCFR